MPGTERKYNSGEYRYGFNGKEKDDEGEFGSITNYDYGFRIYNPAIGKFLSVDPLSTDYPMLTPYQFASNTPIQAIDLDGLEMYRDLGNRLDPVMQKLDADDVDRAWFNLGFGMGMGAGALIGLEVFVTKGNATKYVTGLTAVSTFSQLHYIDKLSNDEQEKVMESIKKEAAFEMLGYGVAKKLEQLAGLGTVLAKNSDELLDGVSETAANITKGGDISPKALDAMKRTDFNDPHCDCSDIADDIHRLVGEGKVLEINGLGKNKVNVVENGKLEEFEYHQVYELDNYIYDPRFSPKPTKTSDYFKQIQKDNPGGVKVEDVTPDR